MRVSALTAAFILMLSMGPTLTAQDIVFLSGSPAAMEESLIPGLDSALQNSELVVVLGDFLDRRTRRRYADNQPVRALNLLRNFSGNVFWVPGKTEWGAIRGNAADNLSFLSGELSEIDSTWKLVPGSGCPGPVAIEVSPDLTLILVNTNWWLHEGEKPSAAECGLGDESGFFVELEELIDQYANTKTLITGYHPLASAGPHGGKFSPTAHLLPPVAGSMYVLYRKIVGGRHDLTNYFYEQMREDLTAVLRKYPDVTYISALEPSFQYLKEPAAEQVIVGNIARSAYTANDVNGAVLSASGFLYYSHTTDRDIATFINESQPVEVSLTQNLLPAPPIEVTDETFPDTITARATLKLRKSGDRPGLLGNNYRGEWEAEIPGVPVFDIDSEKGGLKIVKQGGGMQTRSLRLEAGDEKQYVLRSIEKYPEKAVPPALRNTLAADLVADQISASHPYAAFVIPGLADAAGVYHTNPKLVYLPDDPRLGKYRKDFGGGLYLFEERPDDDWRDQDSFGNSKSIMSTSDVIEKLQNDGDHFIDQEQTVRSRLFDIWIGDWDRHDDQWRWARYKPDNENDIKYYKPIPRDRDQAFFWSDGSLLRLTSRRWGQPKFQGFNGEIRDVGGLEFNARHFDRTFLTEADRALWIQTAADLKERLTDEVIASAIRQFPPEIYALHGEEIENKLRKRRDDLVKYAEEYYRFLSDVVTITASDKEDLVEVNRREDGTVEVSIWRIKGKSGEKKYRYYHRTFFPEETREIRIFAFGDDDIVRVGGESSNGPLLRIIGGKGDDEIRDSSRVQGLRKKTVVYDNPGTEIHEAGEVKSRLSAKEQINRYDRYWYQFNTTMPLVTGGFNPDDGVFVGGGFVTTRHGFRKEPYKVRHRVVASIAPRSGSYILNYSGHFTGVAGAWDLKLEGLIAEPSYADFFYGMGNKTNFNEELQDDDRQFYRVHYGQWILAPLLSRSSNNGQHTVEFGPTFRSIEIEEDDNEDGDRFISLYADYVGRGDESEIPLLETTRNYAGMRALYQLDLRDNEFFPKEGLYLDLELAAVRQIGDEKNQFQRIRSSLSAYFTFGGALRTTIAGRAGGQANFGTYEFYQAARLGGTMNLRGYRKFRFTGRQAFYTNLELRTKLLKFDSFLFPAEVGLLAFHDLGRVWTERADEPVINPDKAVWHRGMGAGIWIAPLSQLVLSVDYGVSNDDEKALFVRFGFMF